MKKRFRTIAMILFLSGIEGRAFSAEPSSAKEHSAAVAVTAGGDVDGENAASASTEKAGETPSKAEPANMPKTDENSPVAEKSAPEGGAAETSQSETAGVTSEPPPAELKSESNQAVSQGEPSENAPAAGAKPIPTKKVSDADISPSGKAAKSAFAQSVTLGRPDILENYKRNRIMQTTGLSMLGTSVLLILAGAAIIEAAPWGSLSRVGISFIGVGLGHFITSAFLLGFSRPIVVQELPAERPAQIIKRAAFYRAQNGDIYF